MVQRAPVALDSSAASFGARSRGASGSVRNSITGGAKRTRWVGVQQMRVQHRLALLFHQRRDVAETSTAPVRSRPGATAPAASAWRRRAVGDRARGASATARRASGG